MRKIYKTFSTFDSAKNFAKSHLPSLLKRNENNDGWLVEYEHSENYSQTKPQKQDPTKSTHFSKSISASDQKVRQKDDAQNAYESALSMQLKMSKEPDIKFEDVVKLYLKAANLGNKKAIIWLDGQFGTPVKENKVWSSNNPYAREQINLRDGVPPSVHSVNKKNRRGQ